MLGALLPSGWGEGYFVLFLLETYTILAVEASWQLEWGNRVFFSHFTETSCGVATLFSPRPAA